MNCKATPSSATLFLTALKVLGETERCRLRASHLDDRDLIAAEGRDVVRVRCQDSGWPAGRERRCGEDGVEGVSVTVAIGLL